MLIRNKKIELLAPAGDLEKLCIAIEYGADAVYFGGKTGSLRAAAGNLTVSEIYEGVEYAHKRDKRAYLAINIYAHEEDLAPLTAYIREVKGASIDAFIVSDPGVLTIIKDIIPDATLHLSTQASTTNALAAKFWKKAGVSRIIAAREMTLAEIRRLTTEAPEVEVEAFVHGAMCVSYSGRCLLSAVMTGRDANKGECAHPCRYKYAVMEEKRPGEFFPMEEDSRGTYIMNSNDLCMIGHISDLAESGIVSFKIEGRMKSLYYAAVVAKAYRQALDAYYTERVSVASSSQSIRDSITDHTKKKSPLQDTCHQDNNRHEEWQRELNTVSHRPYSTGFYYGRPGAEALLADTDRCASSCDFVGIVKSYDEIQKIAIIEQRNKINQGDLIEFFGPKSAPFSQTMEELFNDAGNAIDSAPHAQQIIRIPMKHPVKENFILRRQKTPINV